MDESKDFNVKYLKKSTRLYKIYGGLFLFSIIVSFVFRPLLKDYRGLADFLVAFPLLSFLYLAPLGLYYSWKSYKLQEGRAAIRFKYFLGHFFFCLLIIWFIAVLIYDLRQFL